MPAIASFHEEQGSRGRCEAFDGFDIIAAPLGGFDQAARDSRIFCGASGNAVTYASHAIKLAKLTNTSGGFYILMHHGGGREVLAIPTFYDGGVLVNTILGLPERVQYALLYTIWKTARSARDQAQAETTHQWAQAYADKRIRQRRATKTRAARRDHPRMGGQRSDGSARQEGGIMIVYNVKRRWFDLKSDAEHYRIAEKLPPDATTKISISDRTQLAALLNALCEPPPPEDKAATEKTGVPAAVIDSAFVDPDFEIPKFLRESWERLMAGKGE